jgi:hypothetical protein
MACQDWANTKAAYRFFSNERVNERDILAGHFNQRASDLRRPKIWPWCCHDTTEFSFRRADGREIGKLSSSHVVTKSRPRHHPVCGILMHSSLAVTAEGLPPNWVAISRERAILRQVTWSCGAGWPV